MVMHTKFMGPKDLLTRIQRYCQTAVTRKLSSIFAEEIWMHSGSKSGSQVTARKYHSKSVMTCEAHCRVQGLRL